MGDAVAGRAHAGCGACRMCLIGRYNLCYNYGNTVTGHRQYGHITQGSYAEYVVNNIRALHKMPEGMSLEYGSAVDPAACGLWTAKRAGINPGDTVVILGSGPIGVFAMNPSGMARAHNRCGRWQEARDFREQGSEVSVTEIVVCRNG